MKSIESEIHALKSSIAAEIASKIEEIADARRDLAPKIRLLLNKGGNGSSPQFLGGSSDSKTVQIALVSVLVDEISYTPAAPQRTSRLKEVEGACERLHIRYEDVLQCSRRATELLKIFENDTER